jgi:glycerophosphoryl diester phosphodiesterase
MRSAPHQPPNNQQLAGNTVNWRIVRRVWADLRFQARTVLMFQLLVQLASFALIGPLLTWLARRLVLLTGEPTISNYAIARFLPTPEGIGCVALLLLLITATLFAEFAGQTWIAGQAIARRPAPLTAAVAAVVRRPLALVRLSVRICTRLLLLALPFLFAALLVWTALLRSHDINYYLATRPPELRHALIIAGVLGAAYALLALWQLGRWILAIPILLFEDASPQHALQESTRRSRGRLLAILGPLSAWWLLIGACGLIAGRVLHHIGNAALNWAGLDFARVLPLVALFFAVGLIGTFVLHAMLIAGHQFLVTRTYAEQREPRQAPSSSENVANARRAFWPVLLATCLLLAGALAFMWWVAVHSTTAAEVAVTAHRGNSSRAPENSLAAFRAAIAAHADFSELDVQRTSDGAVVVLHDGDLMRMAGDPRKIGTLTARDLETIDIGRKYGPAFIGEHVPTLAAVIATVRGRMKLNVELKYNVPDPQLAAAVLEVLRQEHFLDQVIITSLDAAALRQVRAIEPRVRIGQIVTVAVGDVAQGDTDFLSLNSARATSDVIRRAHAVGKQVHVWTVDRAEVMLRMIERGADNLITNDPELAVRVVQEHRSLPAFDGFALRLRVLFTDPPAELMDPQAVPVL